MQIYRDFLFNVQNRLNSGEDLDTISTDYANILKLNPNINSLYSYYERRGFGFKQVLYDRETRVRFFTILQELTQIMNETFLELTKDSQKIFYKDKVGKWIINFSNKFNEFGLQTPKIGQFDRFHILACMFFALRKNRKTKFITIDILFLNYQRKYICFIIIIKKN